MPTSIPVSGCLTAYALHVWSFQLESLGLSFPSNYSAPSILNTQAAGGLPSSQSSRALPAELQHLTPESRPPAVPVTLSTSTSSSSSRVPKRGSAYEDEGSIREKAKFVEWMKNEEALLGGDNLASEIVGKQVTVYPQRLILTSR
jgi:hypothetical protein